MKTVGNGRYKNEYLYLFEVIYGKLSVHNVKFNNRKLSLQEDIYVGLTVGKY